MHVKYFWFSKKVLKLHLSPGSTPVVDNLKCKVSKIWKVGNASTNHAYSRWCLLDQIQCSCGASDLRGSLGTSTSSSLSSSRFNLFVKWLNSPLLSTEDKDAALDSAVIFVLIPRFANVIFHGSRLHTLSDRVEMKGTSF